MNLSVPGCVGRVSPVFDVSRKLLVVELEGAARSFVSKKFTDRSFLTPGCCRRKRYRGGQYHGHKERNRQGG